jgi:two-component system response regulator YesN
MKADLRILAVEDETAVAQFLALILCGPNCKVSTARDGLDALAKLETSPQSFDIIITDHRMPRLCGLELVRELRERNFDGKIAVLSAHLDEATVRGYEEQKVDVMISKPFDVDQLRGAINALAEQIPAYATRAVA